jgi:hypothetical protein
MFAVTLHLTGVSEPYPFSGFLTFSTTAITPAITPIREKVMLRITSAANSEKPVRSQKKAAIARLAKYSQAAAT